jgi:hypothetical protein
LRSAATFCTNRRAAAHQPALPSQRHSFQSLEVAMGIFTGLTSSATGRRTERSEGVPIPTICCGVCTARLFGLRQQCTHAGGESMREMLSEKCALRPVGDRIRGSAW